MPGQLPTSPGEVAVLARHVTEAISVQVSGYGLQDHDEVLLDILETNQRSVELYLRTLATQQLPLTEEMRPLSDAARRRVLQGFPLESVLRAYRIGTRAMWEYVVDNGCSIGLREVSDLTLRYIDSVSTAAEVAYLAEREAILNSREQADRLFLERLAEEDFADAVEVESSAAALSHDLTVPSFAVMIEARIHKGARPADEAMASLVAELRRHVPSTMGAVLRRGVLLVIPGTSTERLEELVEPILCRYDPEGVCTVGIGRPAVGGTGLAQSVQEAQRALTLGDILAPDSRCHPYADVRFFDLFRPGDALDEFVTVVLTPFIGHDEGRRFQLIPTLHTYFSMHANRKATARRLGIHANTLDYRLKQAEAVAGNAMFSGEFAFQFELALRLLPISRHASLLAEDEPGSTDRRSGL